MSNTFHPQGHSCSPCATASRDIVPAGVFLGEEVPAGTFRGEEVPPGTFHVWQDIVPPVVPGPMHPIPPCTVKAE